jgi:hypothetical protein
MRMLVLVAAAAVVAVGCGGSDSSGLTGTSNNGPMTAKVDGSAWVAIAPAASYKNNILAIVGIDLGSGATIEVGSAAVTHTGTYSLAFSNLNAGTAILTQAGKSWSSSNQGGTGNLVITTLTTNHVVATFTFDAPPQTGGATGVRHVTNGKIDLTF